MWYDDWLFGDEMCSDLSMRTMKAENWTIGVLAGHGEG